MALKYTGLVTIQCPYCKKVFELDGDILDNRHNIIDCAVEGGCGETFVVDIILLGPTVSSYKIVAMD